MYYCPLKNHTGGYKAEYEESLHTSDGDSVLLFASTASCKHLIEHQNLLREVVKVYSILVISNTIQTREIQTVK